MNDTKKDKLSNVIEFNGAAGKNSHIAAENNDNDMSSDTDVDSKKKSLDIRHVIFILPVFAVVIVLFIIFGNSSFNGTDSVNTEPITVSGNDNFDFCEYKQGYIYAADGKISCYNTMQQLQWEINGSKSAPTIVTNNNYVLTYYKKDSTAYVTNGTKTVKIKAAGNVIFGSINKNGYVSLITEEDGFKNQIAVFDKKGKAIYRWHNSDKYITSAVLSDSNKILALSQIDFSDSGTQSNVIVRDIVNGKNINNVKCDDSVICKLYFTNKNQFVVVTDTKTFSSTAGAKIKWTVDYNGKKLYTYDISEKGIALVFGEDDSALGKSIVKFYNYRGNQIGEFKSESKVKYIDMQGKRSMLVYSKGISVTNNKGKKLSDKSIGYDMKKCIYMGNKRCVLIVSGSGASLIKTD